MGPSMLIEETLCIELSMNGYVNEYIVSISVPDVVW